MEKEIFKYLNEVASHIPHNKFSPCEKCSTTNCCGCPKYSEWFKFATENPITEEEQRSIDIINEVRTFCNEALRI